MRRLAFIAVCLAVGIWGQAATEPAAEIPFVYRDGFIWVEVKVPGDSKPLRCLFDTGSGAHVIDLRVARRLGWSNGRRVKVKGVEGEAIGYWVSLPGATMEGVALSDEFLAVDLRKLSDACDSGVDGLVGVSFLRGRSVQIDFKESRIRLLAPEDASPAGVVVPLEFGRGGVRVRVGVGPGEPGWVRLDTGCASALHWVSKPVTKAATGAAHIVASVEESRPGGMAHVRLGALIFDKVRVVLRAEQIVPGESGLLGNGFLSRFSAVTIDGRFNRLILNKDAPSE